MQLKLKADKEDDDEKRSGIFKDYAEEEADTVNNKIMQNSGTRNIDKA